MAKRIYPKLTEEQLNYAVNLCRVGDIRDPDQRKHICAFLTNIIDIDTKVYSVVQLQDRIRAIIKANREGKAVEETAETVQEKLKNYKEFKDALKKAASERVTNDPVNHPSHYTTGKIEVIDFIEDKELGFCLGNAVKYIARAGKKDPKKEREDLEKAVWYVNRKIKQLGDK